MNVIVGPNNSGKTNLLRVLGLLRDLSSPVPGMSGSREYSRDFALFSGDNLKAAFQISVGVDFGASGLETIRRFLRAYFKTYPFVVDETFATRLAATMKPSISEIPLDRVRGEYMAMLREFTGTDFGDSLTEALAESVTRGTIVLVYEGDPGQSPSIRYDFQVDNETKVTITLYGGSAIVSGKGVPAQELPKILQQVDFPIPGFVRSGDSSADLPTRESLKASFDAKMFLS
jgi:hypothetical protein